jgi:hypothetical protein
MAGRKFAHEPVFTVLRGGKTVVVCKCDRLRLKAQSLEEAVTAYGLHTALAGIQEKRRVQD